MGVVYAANDLSDGRRVAIKVLEPATADDRAVARMRNEASIGQAVVHPAVVSVLDAGAVNGLPYVVMEYVSGVSLHSILAGEGVLPLRRALRIVAQILAGLDAIHTAGFVHGDVKTDNVLVARCDDFDRVKIIDLGLAHPTDEACDGKIISGTPEYLAPEVIRGECSTVASDIYSVGIILYELVTGAPPFCDDTADEIMRRQLEDEVVPPSLRIPGRPIPGGLENAILRALAKRPEDRFASAADLARTLTKIHMTEEQAIATARLPNFSTTGPTQQWTHRQIAPRPVRPAESDAIIAARGVLGREITAGNPDGICVAALELASRLLLEHRLYAAAKELETTLDILTQGRDATLEPGPLWRLLLSLAAIYDGLGNAERASATAALGLRQAAATKCGVGEQRARVLLERLAAAHRRAS